MLKVLQNYVSKNRVIEMLFCILLYWGSSWGSRKVFLPKMPYFAKMSACPMKNSEMTFIFMWNLESLCIHNLAYTIPLVGHGQGLVYSTCLTWNFFNTYHMFFHEAKRICTAQATKKGNQYASPATWIWTMWLLLLSFCPSTQYNGPFEPAN